MIRKLVLEEIIDFFGLEKLLEELPTHAEAIQAIVDWTGSEEVFFELAQFCWLDSVDHVYVAIVEILDIEKAKPPFYTRFGFPLSATFRTEMS